MTIRYVLIIGLLLSSSSYAACDKLLSANISKISIPTENKGQPGLGGITDFSTDTKDCTLECRCLFDSKQKNWQVAVSANKVCVFENQCKACKANEEKCEIRFQDLQTSSRYQQIFYAKQPYYQDIQRCHYSGAKVQCEKLDKLPDYQTTLPEG